MIMFERTRPKRRTSAIALTALLIAACGGSGGGAVAPSGPPALDGTYHVLVFQAEVAGGAMVSATGRYVADPAGNLTGGATWVAGAGSPGPVTPDPLTYTVDQDRSLELLSADGHVLEGRIASDGSLAVATGLETDADPVLVLMVRRHPDPTMTDLAGRWLRVDARSRSDSTLYSVGLTEVTISDRGSHLPGPFKRMQDGVLTEGGTGPIEVTHSWSVEPDGWVRIQGSLGSGVDDQLGALSSDGQLLVMGKEPDGSGWTGIQIYVRAGEQPPMQELAGDYGYVSKGLISSIRPLARAGSMDLLATGDGTMDMVVNVDGTVLPWPDPVTVEFLPVPGTGERLGQEWDDAEYFEGAFTPNRRLGVFGGRFENGESPELLLVLR